MEAQSNSTPLSDCHHQTSFARLQNWRLSHSRCAMLEKAHSLKLWSEIGQKKVVRSTEGWFKAEIGLFLDTLPGFHASRSPTHQEWER